MRPMPQTFDLMLSKGTVVNHDGAAVRDIGVRDGRIADPNVIVPRHRLDTAQPLRPRIR